jgi:outer membrane protein assembly factor BamB
MSNELKNDPVNVAASAPTGVSASRESSVTKFRPLRTWPAWLLVGLMFLARFGPWLFEDGASTYWMISIFGPLLCCLLLVIWWLTASRATWKERLLGFLGLAGGLTIILWLVHPTMRGPGTTYLTMPMGMVAFALGTTVLRQARPVRRTGVALLLALAGFAFSILLRNEGMTGDYKLGARWRWSKSSEALLLAKRPPEAPATDQRTPAVTRDVPNPEWPGFRGPDRAARFQGPPLSTNWSAHPPRQLWKIPVGPAWSSFVVAGNFLFTQEQRGPKETVVCYDAETGRELWSRPMEARFDDPLGGPGPRATPTLAQGRLFATGATGTFLCLNPSTGDIAWQQDLKSVSGRTAAPMWGFSASPVVSGKVVIVYAGGPGDKGLLAFDVESGALRWSVAAGNDSYSSPQLSAIAGQELVLMLSNNGLLCVEPATGKTQLNYEWKFANYRALQPHVAGQDTVLLPTGMTTGTRAIRITHTNEQWAAQELWTSRQLKPDFTDLVSFQGFVYGNDGGILTCVDLRNGERQWKAGRYGKGQILLLENSGLLLVAAEQGQVVLLRADPKEHSEIASFQALEGKCWNHPVVVRDRLYVRNAQEAACWQLPLAETRMANAGPDGAREARDGTIRP